MSQRIKLGRHHVTVHHFTGKVAEATKGRETIIQGSGGGGFTYQGTGGTAQMQISGRTVTHDHLFLVDQEGTERAFQLQDFDIACRTGNIVTVMWGIVDGDQKGPYFAAINHSTSQEFTKSLVMKQIVAQCNSLLPIKNPVLVGVLTLGLFFYLLYIWWPLVFVLIGYLIYFNVVTIRNGVATLQASLKYPAVEKW